MHSSPGMRSAVPNLAKLLHRRVRVQMAGAGLFEGLLTGYDAFMNLVLHDVAYLGRSSSAAVLRGECVESIVSADG